ncbi:hypothetical protein HPB49_021013 [Dermacentor silvarum]|uniref:Uncharacterized protein n=1 Tax=Dermacentor silvarum TaxID=543639 RepID=A0ACB8CBE3_DERSI|nr:hypothetical protein HPB49_021013 [Dermacentor silvarum]
MTRPVLLTGATTLLAFRRFVARCGVPSVVHSDNAQAFGSCTKTFASILPALQQYAAEIRVQWNFIVERAPWRGGWGERLVRSTKNALKRSLGRSSLNVEALTTVLCEDVAVVNTRPLTYP